MKKTNVEVEGGELLLRSKEGHYAVIPAKHRAELEDLVKNDCDDCINDYIQSLPKESDYAVNGTLINSNNVITDPTDPPKKRKRSTNKEFSQRINDLYYSNISKNSFDPILANSDDFSHITELPGKELGDDQLNCIQGVCNFYREADDTSMTTNYTGNIKFTDNAANEGWYKVNTKHGDYEPISGDMIRYTLPAEEYARKRNDTEMLANINDSNRYDPKVGHTSGIVVTDQGPVMLNNEGQEVLFADKTTVEDLRKRIKEGVPDQYTAAQIWRYDPDEVDRLKEEKIEESKVLQGIGKNAPFYDTQSYNRTFNQGLSINKIINKEEDVDDNYFDGEFLDTDSGQKLMDVFTNKEFYDKIGKTTGLLPETFNKVLDAQMGIAAKETVYGSSPKYAFKQSVPDKYVDDVKSMYEFVSGTKDKHAWMDDYIKNHPEESRKAGGDFLFKEELKKEYSESKSKFTKKAEKEKKKAERSKGVFQQKNESFLGKHHGYELNSDDLEGQAAHSIGLMIQNMKEAKELYPNITDDQAIEIATIMHAKPTLARFKKYMDYYYFNKDNKVDYLEEVKSLSDKTLTKPAPVRNIKTQNVLNAGRRNNTI